MTFDDFLAPISAKTFRDEFFGKAPLHISRSKGPLDRPLEVLDWAGLERIMAMQSHLTPDHVRMFHNGDEVDGARLIADNPVKPVHVDIRKIQHYLSQKCSLLVMFGDQVDESLSRICGLIEREFTVRSNANIYCSFEGVSGLSLHCDTHHVWVLQAEGKKLWRIYDGPDLHPVKSGFGSLIDGADGKERKVVDEFLLEAGDLLYVPRGLYHEAAPVGGASLHVTFSGAALTGRQLRPFLAEWLANQPDFCADLPAYDEDDGQPLRARLAELGDALAAQMQSPTFFAQVQQLQERRVRHSCQLQFPDQPALDFFLIGKDLQARAATLLDQPEHGADDMPALSFLLKAKDWLASEKLVSAELVSAQFPGFTRAEIEIALSWLCAEGLIAKLPNI